MDEDSYKDQFDAMTQGMKLEKIYDQLADRAEAIRILAMHCGEIYKTARKAGMSRKTSHFMAREFFRAEMSVEGSYYPGEG